MSYKDLREFLDRVDEAGELRRLRGVDWNLEVGAIGQMTNDAVLIDDIAGYPRGYRIILNMITGSVKRWLLALNWETQARGNDLAREFKDRLLNFKPVSPEWVTRGPVLENIQEGKDVNVLKFPVPKIHPEDAGRYIGTACAVISKDPDTGRVNFGTFRLQAHDESSLGLYIASRGKDAGLILKSYHDQGKACPIVVLVGPEPAILYAAPFHMVHIGTNGEYELAGWLKGEPIQVIKGDYTGLPIPAYTEIALEGEVAPGDTKLEGPFGEWTGYGEPRQAYVIRVKRVLHRNDPILAVQSPSGASRPPARGGLAPEPTRASWIWEQMERAGIRGITGVAVYVRRFLTVVSIKNSYAGHSRQAGYVATQCTAGAFMGKYTIVVDDDIDPYNIDQVIWAVSMRADPQRSIETMRYCWSDCMDSALALEERVGDEPMPVVYNSRCIIDACKPIEWPPDLKKAVVYSRELEAKVIEKYGKDLFPKGRPDAARMAVGTV